MFLVEPLIPHEIYERLSPLRGASCIIIREICCIIIHTLLLISASHAPSHASYAFHGLSDLLLEFGAPFCNYVYATIPPRRAARRVWYWNRQALSRIRHGVLPRQDGYLELSGVQKDIDVACSLPFGRSKEGLPTRLRAGH